MSTADTNLPKEIGYKTIITSRTRYPGFSPYDFLTKDLTYPFSHLSELCKDKSREIL